MQKPGEPQNRQDADLSVNSPTKASTIFQIALLSLAALSVSTIGAYFSITGLSRLFIGASLSVICMACALEFSKLVSAWFLHHHWRALGGLLKAYLTFAVIMLSAITSGGIFGYLSGAYQSSGLELKKVGVELTYKKEELKKIEDEKVALDKAIDEIPMNRVSKRLAARNAAADDFKKVYAELAILRLDIEKLMVEKQKIEIDIGPLVYLSEGLHVPMDSISLILILIFVSVFDPLAICLVLALSWFLKKDQQKASASPTLLVNENELPISLAPQPQAVYGGAPKVAVSKAVRVRRRRRKRIRKDSVAS